MGPDSPEVMPASNVEPAVCIDGDVWAGMVPRVVFKKPIGF